MFIFETPRVIPKSIIVRFIGVFDSLVEKIRLCVPSGAYLGRDFLRPTSRIASYCVRSPANGGMSNGEENDVLTVMGKSPRMWRTMGSMSGVVKR